MYYIRLFTYLIQTTRISTDKHEIYDNLKYYKFTLIDTMILFYALLEQDL